MKVNRRMVGTNYHPHDWSPEQWEKDLDSMKEAGFTVIRVGHLCWDSFEPKEGQYEFGWMDRIFDLCEERGIGVFLDIPTRPAPLWLHRKYPSIDIVDTAGQRLDPNTRYMVDVGDPHFQEYALRLAAAMAKRYKDHPALLAFGLCNELGSGFHSYSPTALARFQDWLRKKYGTLETLNTAWNSKRWSRRVQDFSDVFFPVSGEIKGAPERFLDMKRFFSDEILNYFKRLSDTVRENAPGVPVSTNHWAENPKVGYDYHKNYRETLDYPGIGFYPGINPEYADGFIGNCMTTDYRIGEMDAPMWCLEFQTGTNGGYGCPRGVMRMYAYLAWIYRSDMVCAWTWRTMLGGEEQYFYGLLDHDGFRSRKYEEFRQLAHEWNALEEKGVRRLEGGKRLAVAYSYDSLNASRYAENYYKTGYTDQVLAAYKALFHQNIDCNVIDLRQVEKEYPLVIVPGHCVMEKESAETIRRMVENGATVIMTAYSAKVDENGTAFSEPLPGYLSNVFGVRVRGFDRAFTHVNTINEGGIEKKPEIICRERIGLEFDGRPLGLTVDYHEYLEPDTAKTVAVYTGSSEPLKAAVTCNSYGKGKAVYVGIPADETLLTELICRYAPEEVLAQPRVPRGVITRALQDNCRIYLNTTGETVEIEMEQAGNGLLSGAKIKTLTLAPYDVEIVKYERE